MQILRAVGQTIAVRGLPDAMNGGVRSCFKYSASVWVKAREPRGRFLAEPLPIDQQTAAWRLLPYRTISSPNVDLYGVGRFAVHGERHVYFAPANETAWYPQVYLVQPHQA